MATLGEINKQDGAPELRRRSVWLFAILIFAFLQPFAANDLFSSIHGERYTFLSENNRVRLKRVPGTRGMVLDRHGELWSIAGRLSIYSSCRKIAPRQKRPQLLARATLKWDESELLKTYEDNKSRRRSMRLLWAAMSSGRPSSRGNSSARFTRHHITSARRGVNLSSTAKRRPMCSAISARSIKSSSKHSKKRLRHRR
jgi:cell division protein FtsI/penicillin-binding protein 2